MILNFLMLFRREENRVEIYFKSHNDLINTKILLQLRNDIRAELRKEFDQVYVELIPSLPD